MAETATSRREPGVAKGGRSAVIMTAATFLVFRLAPRMLTPWRSIIPSSDWRVKGELRRLSPVPFRPTTRP
ncbi:hypothetical protein D3C75_1124140 [compost metagenome]